MRGRQTRLRYVRLQKATHVAQTLFCRHRVRSHYLQLQSATILLQSLVRRWRAGRELEALREGRRREQSAVLLQSLARSCLARRQYLRMKNAAITIQKYTRMHQAITLLTRLRREREEGRRRDAALLIQSAYRGYIQHQCYREMLRSCVVIQAH